MKTLIFKALCFLKMCPIFFGSVHNFWKVWWWHDIVKKCLFSINADMVWCPTWSKNHGRYLIPMLIADKRVFATSLPLKLNIWGVCNNQWGYRIPYWVRHGNLNSSPKSKLPCQLQTELSNYAQKLNHLVIYNLKFSICTYNILIEMNKITLV